MTDIILRFMSELSELLVEREYPPYFCNYHKCLPRISGGGPRLYDEAANWGVFTPRKRGVDPILALMSG